MMNFGCQSFVAVVIVKQQKSSTTTKQSIVFSVAATTSVELLLIETSMGHQTFLCYLPRWFRRRGDRNHFAVPDNLMFLTKKHAVKYGMKRSARKVSVEVVSVCSLTESESTL